MKILKMNFTLGILIKKLFKRIKKQTYVHGNWVSTSVD